MRRATTIAIIFSSQILLSAKSKISLSIRLPPLSRVLLSQQSLSRSQGHKRCSGPPHWRGVQAELWTRWPTLLACTSTSGLYRRQPDRAAVKGWSQAGHPEQKDRRFRLSRTQRSRERWPVLFDPPFPNSPHSLFRTEITQLPGLKDQRLQPSSPSFSPLL